MTSFERIITLLNRRFSLVVPTVILFYLTFSLFVPTRVGDGSEYILQYAAFVESTTPWITESAVRYYDFIVSSSRMVGMVPSENLIAAFPELRIASTFDLNHFWLYSSLAGAIHNLMRIFLVDLSAHSSFLLLHSALFSFLILIARKRFQKIGVITVLVLTVGSPILWYGNKIHTEFFTFCLITAASIFVLSKELLKAAAVLSLASTQNPSIAITAISLILLYLTVKKFRGLDKRDYTFVLGSLAIMSLHPLYYWVRYNVLTPQFIAGGVDSTFRSENLLLWFLDPDIGLLTNWPLGVFLILLHFFYRCKTSGPFPENFYMAVYLTIFIVSNLFAQSLTENLNSGGTMGPARYGFWYIGLFFPILLKSLQKYSIKTHLFSLGNAKIVVLVFILISAVMSYSPSRPENYSSPSITSRIIQTHFPKLYKPPFEVFIERYSGYGEEIRPSTVGPDCRTIAIVASPTSNVIASPRKCLYSSASLKELITRIVDQEQKNNYYSMSDTDQSNARLILEDLNYEFNSDSPGVEILTSGWSAPESWGTWSDSSIATLAVPCNVKHKKIKSASLFMGSFGIQPVAISTEGTKKKLEVLFQEGETKNIEVSLNRAFCKNGFFSIKFEIPKADSPRSLGISDDARKLGISIIRMSINN
jgi:hypothetical protein